MKFLLRFTSRRYIFLCITVLYRQFKTWPLHGNMYSFSEPAENLNTVACFGIVLNFHFCFIYFFIFFFFADYFVYKPLHESFFFYFCSLMNFEKKKTALLLEMHSFSYAPIIFLKIKQALFLEIDYSSYLFPLVSFKFHYENTPMPYTVILHGCKKMFIFR